MSFTVQLKDLLREEEGMHGHLPQETTLTTTELELQSMSTANGHQIRPACVWLASWSVTTEM